MVSDPEGYVHPMTIHHSAGSSKRTAAAMHDTAEQLEEAEATLHGSAEAARDQATTERLHQLGDEVTAQAKDIDRRADRLEPAEHPAVR
jgi:hypothetical protein